ncbi:MAG: TlpA family protein disulfide reductase [Polyangiaceae bacterium]|nr:TlpA family protein disulfide reductase [Polyangiaceae bacterium]
MRASLVSCLVGVLAVSCGEHRTRDVAEPDTVVTSAPTASTMSPPVEAAVSATSASSVSSAPPPMETSGQPDPATTIAPDTETGRTAPLFTLRRVDGQDSISLQKLRGKVVVLYFFATFVAPAERAFPVLDDLGKKLDPKKVAFVAIAVDEASEAGAVTAFARKFKTPVVHDGSGNLAAAFKLDKLPMMFLVDRDGIIRSGWAGFDPSQAADLEAKIAASSKP